MMDFLVQKAYAVTTLGGSTAGSNETFDVLFKKINDNVVSPVIYLIMSLAIVYFIWGVMVFIKNADNVELRKEGSMHMLWGIIGIFIMVSAKGIIYLIISSMGL